jgi:mRNA-degrading endonuclease RelE of RelBE toxin-antitoxin system
MAFRIADTFSDSLTKLTNQEQKAVKTAAFDLQMNPDSPGLSMHRVDRAKDRYFWTARVNRDIRLVVHKKDRDTLLAWVGHHDDAYKWAESRRIDTHPTTGAAQIVEIRETVEEIIVHRVVEEAIELPRIFDNETEENLLLWGVPTDWISTVKEATEDTILDIADHLPMEAAEALLLAATGGRPEPIVASTDPYSHPDASRRFKVLENESDLERALEAPWEKWTTYLHPAQREFVERNFNGPARVIGSAGTGKTIVALHRAVRFAKENPNNKVLLTTFNERLVESLRSKIKILASHEVAQRISVTTVLDFAKQEADRFLLPDNPVSKANLEQIIETVLAKNLSKFSAEFIFEEWNLIIDAWGITSLDEYLNLPRLGRRVRLAAGKREEAWKLFEAISDELRRKDQITKPQLLHAIARQYTSGVASNISHLVVDEAQDLSVDELILLASIAAGRPNSLFFAGDIGQRIFRAPFPWRATGVEIKGRSRTLKLNYRTSEQIRRESDKLLPESIIESDGNEERRDGVISLFQGAQPSMEICTNEDDEINQVTTWTTNLINSGINPNEIAILFRSVFELDRAKKIISKLGSAGDDIHLLTMHDAKGLEFKAVAIVACEEGILPSEARLLNARDEADIDEIMATERHLFYVAFSRAREHVLVTCSGQPSEYLTDLGC